jgi:hypothetical protein
VAIIHLFPPFFPPKIVSTSKEDPGDEVDPLQLTELLKILWENYIKAFKSIKHKEVFIKK